MDYLLGILTGVIAASWCWWELMKRQAALFYRLEHDRAEEQKKEAQLAIDELMNEVNRETHP